MVRNKDDKFLVYDIYETRASLQAFTRGGSIQWTSTSVQDKETGEFTVPFTLGPGFAAAHDGNQPLLPFTPGEPCPTCGKV